MAKSVKRVCPACQKEKTYRADQITCGCKQAMPRAAMNDNEQIAYLRKENSRLESKLSGLQDVRGFQKELLSHIETAISALEPMPAIKPVKARKPDAEVAAVIKFSDWHIGEIINPSETEGFGSFDWQIAQDRVREITQKFLSTIDLQRQMYNIKDLYVFAEGDFVSGDIHRELTATNEFPVPVQAVKAGQLLASSVAAMAPHFKSVKLIEVGADNHSRLNPKPQAKQKASNSYSYVVHAIANAMLRDHKNVDIDEAAGIFKLVNVNGYGFLSTHGDNCRGGFAGIPIYSMIRMQARESTARMKNLMKKSRIDDEISIGDLYEKYGFDYISMGHFHVPSIIDESILVNGSLSGTTEFDHLCGRDSKPAQVSFLVHPKHGMFNWTAWRPSM